MVRTLFPIIVLLLTVARAGAEPPSELLARYVNEETLGVARIHFDGEQGEELAALLAPHMTKAVDRRAWQQLEPRLKQGLDRPVYAVVSLGDISPQGPSMLFILPALSGEEEKALIGAAIELQNALELNLRKVNGHVILAPHEDTLDRYESIESQPRPDLLEPLAETAASDVNLAIVVSPGADARRVLREMWPKLPAPFDAITGPLVADGMRHITLSAKLPPEWSANVTVATTNEQVAQTLAESAEQAIATLVPLIQPRLDPIDINATAFASALTPERDGMRVHIQISHEDEQVAAQLAKFTSVVVGEAMESAHRTQRVNHFKNLSLAILNFEATRKFLPSSAAICDKDGTPLLSWRVAILPFLDEMELFKEFRLDEPWDSEHNLKLLDRMPGVYADPGRSHRAGKTTVQVPVHPETVFPPEHEGELETIPFAGKQLTFRPGTIFREITDGTSNTIMIVEVAPERAVPWTKPADWEVDLDNPLEGLKQERRKGFDSAMCDGSVHFLPFDIDPKYLRARLTRAGGEVIDR